jgi:precorrin-6B methylase 2
VTAKKTILVIGRHATMMEKVIHLLEQEGYAALGVQENEAAFNIMQTETINAVVIGGGVDGESRALFHRAFPLLQPGVKLVDAHPQTLLAQLGQAFAT